ncbi:tRNA (adenosine(37)-N6)-threonylcarbamoyltransferase complex transferase subunit TsaD [Candidatus Bandiella euplotis]|uniref:tRNA N6-adenosine threonylcarbamoyltransferase n=1 Tax=Candidatus Bandiella euplotis TaxID=1664265 RepID=A0ABZ0ULV3_9RICK|nr:tRNA (adenosine(37)-N6)-threonylcarbamoyltransferase complex transferase subunit TsaD [Candidatus Bandiella woodruffii]WPX97116.1 tRNA N6-adenosine threonylcarbamoyltransferase [Candidatus Bandiella woodruffii]
MIVLAIETSCDETAVAIMDENRNILGNKVLSQTNLHEKFGGVVPEIAARSHVEFLPQLLEDTLAEANLKLNSIDAIAATGGPGLIGGVMVGVMYAKTIASVMKKKFIAVNHLEGHALAVRITEDVEYPYLLLLISGGHCQTIIAEDLGKYHVIGRTIDDAVGEAFDKVAKMLDLGYPGGVVVERFAQFGDEKKYVFPKPLIKKGEHNFSFSGLKTAVRNQIIKMESISEQDKADICASFQYTVAEILNTKLIEAAKSFSSKFPNSKDVVISGGVASNLYIRGKLGISMDDLGYRLLYPPIDLCTDNAAMIAWAAIERLERGCSSNLCFKPKSRWQLNEITY